MAYKLKIGSQAAAVSAKKDTIITNEVFNNALNNIVVDTTKASNAIDRSINTFEEGLREASDESFQSRIESAGGWGAIYDALDITQKGELQDSDTDFNIEDSRIRGSVFHNQETTLARPNTLNPDKEVYDTSTSEFDEYLLNELNPVADTHYNRENPFLSIFAPNPSSANPGGFLDAPTKATHEYIKREMGQDAYDTLVSQAEAKFISEKGVESLEAFNKSEAELKRSTEIEGLKNYSYRDKKNVLLPLLDKMEKEAEVISLQEDIVSKSQKIDPTNTTKSGANLQKTYEAQLDSIYQQSPDLIRSITSAGENINFLMEQASKDLIDTYRNEGYGEAGITPEAFLKDQGLEY